MASRSLTAGEIALAQQIFGTTINYSNVRIHNEKWIIGQPDNTIMTPNGEIYYPPAHHSTDFSSGSSAQKALFIHEMGHVLQYQNGMNVKLKAILGGGNYDYDPIFHGTPFHKLPMEAQAEFLEDYYRKLNGIDVDPNKKGGTLEDPDRDISEYEEVMPIDLPGADPGNGSLPDLAEPQVPPVEQYGPWIPQTTIPFDAGVNAASPIVLDIDASGTIELVALNDLGSVYWDIDQDGFREASGWITGGDGLLCIDLNSDGIINDHGELFGGSNGYVTLAAYDTNSSSTITSADTDFGDLLVWVDSNADGYSQSGELHTLTSLGITSISTAYSNVNYEIAGNEIKYQSTFVMNGNTYTTVDAFFDYDNVNSKFAGEYTLDDRVVFMPTLRGYGNLPDLHIAMSMDEDLLDMVTAFSQLDLSDMMADVLNSEDGAIVDILYRWAGVDDVNPTTRGPFIDARVLEFLEEFMGKDYVQLAVNSPNPNGQAADFLMEAWGNAFNAFASRLAYQASGAEAWFDGGTYNPVSDTFETASGLNFSAIENWLSEAESLNGQISAARFLLGMVDEIIGIVNLSTPDYDDLESLLPYSVSIESYMNLIEGPGTLYGDAEDNLLLSDNSWSSVNAYDGNDTLVSGTGGDSLYGGAGDDSYIFTVGSGADYLQESIGQGTDTVRMTGYAVNEVRMWTQAGNSLYIGNKADPSDYVRIVAATTGAAGTVYEIDVGPYVEQVVFDDATTWSLTGGLTLEGHSNTENIYGSQYGDQINGMGGADSLYGNRGNDTLIGGTGGDTLNGGSGDDTYVFAAGSGVDYLQELTGEGTDTIRMSGYTTNDVRMWTNSTSFYIGNKADPNDYVRIAAATTGASGTTNEMNVGPYVEQVMFDDATTWSLTGGLSLEGSSNSENIYGSAYADLINGMGGYDSLYGNRGNDTLIGGAEGITLYGGAGDDILYAGAGYDYLDGQGDNDTVTYGTAASAVTVNLATGNQNTGGSGYDTILNIENVIGSAYNDTLTGTTADNIMDGGNGDDTIEGGVGNDTLTGGSGIDTVSYVNAGSAVTVNLATTTGQNTTGAGTDTLSGFENLRGSAFNDTLTGNNSDNVIEGGAGNDTINASGGTDTLSYSNAGAGITIDLATTTGQNTGGAGTDTISNFENLRGSAFNDTLTGTSGNNVIEGGAGNDTINGQGGTDTLTYANAAGAVTVSLAVATAQNTVGAGTDTISNMENLAGSAYGDTLTGSTTANTIDGGNGDDTIEGGAGNDTMTGGSGTDTVSYVNAGSAVTVNLATTSGQNTAGAGTDTVSGFENLKGSAFNDTLTGNSSSNTIEGGAGNDTINGSGGTDTLSYANAGSGVTVNLATTTGQNTVGAGTDTISSMENLIGSAYNDTLTGTSSANTIEGGAGNDSINGSGGTDTLSYASAGSGVTVNLATATGQNTGGAGTDTISSMENLIGSAHNDTLTGTSTANTIQGGAGADTISAGDGADFLYGGAGADTLTGSTGGDAFLFEAASALGASDTITDFSTAQLDKLDVSDILSAYDPLTHAISDFVRITDNGTHSFLSVDADGGGNSFTQIAQLSSVTNLAAGATATGIELQAMITAGTLLV